MSRKRQSLIVVALLGLSALVQAAIIARATTTDLDAVRFVATARSIERRGVLPTLRSEAEQPLFPVCVWAVHAGLRKTTGDFPSVWAASAQAAAAIPLVLAVVPVFLLVRRLVGVAAAVAGSLMFCLLPAVARLGAAGLSDSTHLLLLCVAFWAMVEYVEPAAAAGRTTSNSRAGSPWWLLLAGVAVAMAALARVEVLVLAAALGLTLAGFQCLPGRRIPWKSLAAAGGCLLLGLAMVWGPYLAATGSLAPRTAVGRLLGRQAVESRPSRPDDPTADWRLPDGEATSFAPKEPSISVRRRGYAPTLVRYGQRLADAMGYWIGILALWGAWRLGRADAGYRPEGRATAGDRLVQVFFVLYSLALVQFGAREGYLESRHLLPLVLAGLGSAGLGALELGASLGRATRRAWGWGGEAAGAWALVAVAGVCCLPLSLASLNDDRLGHRQAAEWLATRAERPGAVLDTLGWTGLYSGRPTYLYSEGAEALRDPGLAYLVLERREVEYASRRSRTLQWLIDSAGEKVAEFPTRAERGPRRLSVVVYRWHPDRFRPLVGEVGIGD